MNRFGMNRRDWREAISRGLTGDKVGAFDPAAAPLHTDAEASSQPTIGSRAAIAHQQQIAARMPRPGQGPFSAMPQPWRGGRAADNHGGWQLAGVTAGLVALGVAAGVLGLTGF